MKKILQALLLIVFQLSLAQNTFKASFENSIRPSKEQIRIDVFDDLGNTGYLPVSIVKGSTKGPIFTIIAGVHGFEYPPIIATQQLLQEIDTAKLKGTLIFIPIANRGSFYSRTPFMNPQDNVNLNNAFPGNSTGTITQRLANVITKNIIPVTDVLLDIHGGDAPEDLLSFICYYDNKNRPKQTQKARELSEKSGFEYVVSYPYTIADNEPAKYTFKQAVQDGKVGLSMESGKLGNVHEEAVALIKNGVYNILAEMNMYGHSTLHSPNFTKLNDQVYISSKVQGIFYSSYKAGDFVTEGELIGYTTDEFGTVIEEYKASKTGIILYMLKTPPVNIGDTVMCLSSYLKENE